MGRLRFLLVSAAWCVSAGCASAPAVVREGSALWGREGARVVVEGAVAREIWQHMMAPPRGYGHETYFDMGKQQIVIYSKGPIACEGRVRASGTVVKIEGSSKDPRRKEACTEYHVAVDSWECLK
ncbi:MAG: hypothetical protein KA369_17810 [Spirochaetes bacterium]|nr:hypothetical protein [Spirochaetota bacterium]